MNRFHPDRTTDVDFDGDPGAITISPVETDYLCAAVNVFRGPDHPMTWLRFRWRAPALRRWRRRRPLATRDFVLEVATQTACRC